MCLCYLKKLIYCNTAVFKFITKHKENVLMQTQLHFNCFTAYQMETKRLD